jgi:hypothetical protein
MKKLFVIIAAMLFSGSVFCQNATLTKKETADYLYKKLEEIKDLMIPQGTTKFDLYPSLTNSFTENKFTFGFYFSSPFTQYKYGFNPAYIKAISKGSEGTSTGWLKITFATNAVAETRGSTNVSSNEAWFPYLLGDGTNYDKIRRALLHLQSLLKAEDDPFAN